MSLVVILETLRRHVTSVAYLVFVSFLVVIAAGATLLSGQPGQWRTFMGLLVLVAGAQLIGPEFSSGTLQLILAKPINRSVYLLSRWAGVVIAIWCAMGIAFAADVIVLLGMGAPVPWSRMVIVTFGLAWNVMLVCAVLACFGSFLRSYLNIGLYFALQALLGITVTVIDQIRPDMRGVIGAMARFFDANPGISAAITAVDRNLFPEIPFRIDVDWVLLIASNTAVLLLLACLFFRRREVPYGAD